MPSGATQTIESFAYEGYLSAPMAAALAVAVAALAAWMLWREKSLVGAAWATLFWLLRAAAAAVVFWMLAGPTHLSTQRLTRPQSIAVLADTSASMDSVDPERATDDLRWGIATSEEESPVMSCDRAVVAFKAATDAGGSLLAAVSEHQPRREISDRLEAAERSVDRAVELMEDAADQVGSKSTPLEERAERVLSVCRGPVEESLEAIRDELAGGGEPAELAEAAANLSELLVGAHRRSQSLAADVVRWQAQSTPPTGVGTPGTTRRERVDALLSELEEGVLDSLGEEVFIQRLRFDSIVSPIDGEGWRQTSSGGPRATPVAYTGEGPDESVYEAEASLRGGGAREMASTDLSGALQRIAELSAEGPLRMVVLLTDGRHNAPDTVSPQDIAARLEGVPIHVAPVGVNKPSRDVIIHRVEAPSAVVINDTAEIEVFITAYDCLGEQLNVTVRHDGEEVDRRRLEVSRDRIDERVVFRVSAEELGMQQYEIEVEPVSDEATLTNNLSAVAIEVVRDKLRVLLADRGPRYEYRYLQQLFRRDEHIDFDEFLTLPELRATGAREATRQLPLTREEWARYEVVILGDLDPKHLTIDRQQALVEYVRQGGNLILVAGQQSMPQEFRLSPLAELVPVEEGGPVDPRIGFAVEVSDEGQMASAVQIRHSFAESRQVWESVFRLAPIYGLSRYHRAKPTAQTLLYATPIEAGLTPDEDQKRSLMCWTPIGAGRVAFLSAPQTYLLRFRRGDRDHHRFWGQTLRWITAAELGSGTERVRLETDRNSYQLGQPVEVTVWLSDPQGRPLEDADFRVEARGLGQTAASTEMRPDGGVAGRYVGVINRLPMGAFEITPAGASIAELTGADAEPVSTLINVQSSGGVELSNTQGNRPLLEQIAELTGGQVLPPTAVEEAFRLVSLDPDVTETTQRTPLWNRWSYMLVVLGCLFTEWVVRKWKGLA